MSPILGIWASQNYSRYQLPTSFESIATTTVGAGGSSSVTFSSIPSTYTHLQVRYIGKTNRSGNNQDNVLVRLNSDTSSNYSWHWLFGDGSSASAGAGTSATVMNVTFVNSTNTTTDSFGVGVIDLLDYKSTNKNKTLRTLSGYDLNGSGFVALCSGMWMNSSSAVTSLQLLPGNGTLFTQNSHFALYGVKGD